MPRGGLVKCKQWNTRQLLEIIEVNVCMLMWEDLQDILSKSKVHNYLYSQAKLPGCES